MKKKPDVFICSIHADCRFCDYESEDRVCPVCKDCKYHIKCNKKIISKKTKTEVYYV